MAKSKYFGYILRNAGTPYQQWVLNELPVSISGIYTSYSTSSIASSSVIPVPTIVLNQIGGRINADGSITLPQGLYKIDYSMIVSTTAAGPVSISLNSGTSSISQVQETTSANGNGSYTATINGTGIIKSCSCGCQGITLSLTNNSSTAITPVSVGSGVETIRVIITRII